MNDKSNLILEVKHLKKYFPLSKDLFGKTLTSLKAVDDVSFTLEKGKTIGVVGESGCGKTTLGRTILQLYDTTGGKSIYYGHTVYEFLPNYYLKAVKNLSNYKKEYNKLKEELSVLLSDELLKDDNYVTLNILDTLLKIYETKLTELSTDDKEMSNLCKTVIKCIEKIKELLEKLSSICGGLVIVNDENIFSLLEEKVKLCKVYKKTKSEEVLTDINNIDVKVLEVKKQYQNNVLFNELENNIETGLNLALLTKEELRSLRTEIQLIFQDPYSSLPPRMTIGEILSEAVKVHNIVPKEEVTEHIRNIMKMCGLQPQYYDRYPHEFSGGQRQRICIARALAVNPKLVICDEPVSALDVSIQAQIINLLKQLQNELGLTYMFISHDLSVVKYITDSIIVMYLGNTMEIGDTLDIFDNPLHPYTKALFSAVPVPDPDAKMNRIILKGDIPSPANPPKGCKFHTRCESCMNVCKFKTPKFIEHTKNHFVTCHLYDEEVMANLDKYDLEYEVYREELEKQKALEETKNKKFKIKKQYEDEK